MPLIQQSDLSEIRSVLIKALIIADNEDTPIIDKHIRLIDEIKSDLSLSGESIIEME